MEATLALARRVARTDATVLIEGETGTGKEMLSRFIHAESPRREGPFVPVNCAALPESLIEAELFGHEKGAFTGAVGRRAGCFETASGGTLLLDEVTEIPLALQAKLLRALQEGEVVRIGSSHPVKVDVRVVAVTNRDLRTEVAAGRFRQDLFYRLNVVALRPPALRDRPGDIAVLARHFLDKYAPGSPVQISQGAMRLMMAYAWPGNVRQLENAVERAVALSSGRREIDIEDLPPEIQDVPQATPAPFVDFPEEGLDLPAYLSSIERDLIRRSLQRTGGNRNKAAELLRIKRTTLVEKLKRLGPD